MTAKEKANEILNRYGEITPMCEGTGSFADDEFSWVEDVRAGALECVLIIMETFKGIIDVNYWNEVKQEIENHGKKQKRK